MKMTKQNTNIIGADWFKSLVEEVEAIAVESVFISRQAILDGKLQIGKLIHQNIGYENVTVLVQLTAQHIKVTERELFWCYKFYEQQEKLKKIPEYSEKTISWNKVKKLLSGPKRTKACEHEHTVKITICEDCGKRV